LLYLRRSGTKIAEKATVKTLEKYFEIYFGCRVEEFGGQQSAVPHVQGLWQAMDKECEVFV
jgi:hypothetical protein